MPFFRMMGIVPLGIGLGLLVFVWGQPFGFGPFSVVASFVALMFILQGAALLSGQATDPTRLAGILDRLRQEAESRHENSHSAGTRPQVGYQCHSCGAPLGENADVSPHGDTKCVHCGKWFNVHQHSI